MLTAQLRHTQNMLQAELERDQERFPGFRRLTRDIWASSPVKKSVKRKIRYHVVAGRRRLTRDFRNRRLTRDSVFPAHFFVIFFRKNRKNRFFGLPGPK